MNRLTQLAVGRRSVTLLLAAGLFIAGIVAWGDLKQELLPDVSFPIVTVIAPYPGAGATDVTEQVTKPIEQAVSGVPGLDQLQSTSSNSFAFVVAQFDYGADIDSAVATIEQNLQSARLPQGVDPTVGAFDFSAAPIVIAAVSALDGTDLEQAAEIARTEIIPELSSIPGVANVDLSGGLEDHLVVTLDPDRMAEAGISTQQVVGVLQANNLTLPGGELPVDGEQIPVSTIGRFDSVDQIKGLIVGVTPPAATGGTPVPVTIGQVGDVDLASLAATGYGRANGQPAVTISVSKTSTANTVSVAEAVQAKLDEIEARHPSEIEIATVSDQSTFILESSEGLLREGGLGALFAVLTIFLFLLNVRSTLVAAVSIPLSILSALVIMQVAGITLNILTLGGLAVAVGRVVDDSIVVLENIYRHRALGDDRLTASIKGPREVASAITASTLTTVAVFLPLGFAGGFVSQFFLSFSLTVTFALLASLIVALTVVPVLAYLVIDKVSGSFDETGEPKNSFWVRAYDPAIRFVLRSRLTKVGTIVVAGLLFFWSISLIPQLPTTFIDSGSEKIVQVTVAPPSGVSSEQVLDQAIKAETILLADPDVDLVTTSVPGEGEVGFATAFRAQQGQPANSATLVVRLDPAVDLDAKIKELDTALEPVATDGYDVIVGQQGGATSNKLTVVVSATDPAVVQATTTAVLSSLEQEAGLANVATDLAQAGPEVQVTVDPNRAILVGSTAAQIGSEVRNALTPQTIGQVRVEEGQPVPFVVRLDPASLTSVEALKAMPVGTTAKQPLGSVADVQVADVQSRITRIDELPSATVTGDIVSGDTGATSAAAQATIDGLRANGSIPTERPGGTRRCDRAASGGLRRPLHRHGRRDPAGLPDDGAGLQLTGHAVHHPVQPAAGGHRRHPRAVADRTADRPERPDRVPHADRDRGHERDRPARPGRAAARRWPLD